MKTRIAYLIVLLVFACSAFGQERKDGDGVILFHPEIKFILNEPAGWVLDMQAGRADGADAVIFPKGSSWKNSVAVMYVRIVSKDEKQKTVEKVISDDVADFMKLSKESTVADSPALQTRDKKQAVIKVFYDAANKNHESVAFIDNRKVVVIIALSSRTKIEYEKALPAFRELVTSYFEFTLSG